MAAPDPGWAGLEGPRLPKALPRDTLRDPLSPDPGWNNLEPAAPLARTLRPSALEQTAAGVMGPKADLQWVSSLSNAYAAFLNEIARQSKTYPPEQRALNPAVTYAALKAALSEARRAFGPEAVNPEHFRILYNAKKGTTDRATYNMLAALDYVSSIATDPTNLVAGPVMKGVGKALSPVTRPVAGAAGQLVTGGKAEVALQNATARAEYLGKQLGFTPGGSSQWQKRAAEYGQARQAERRASAAVQGQRGLGKLGAKVSSQGPVRWTATAERHAKNQLAQEAAHWLKSVEAGVSLQKGAILTRPSSLVADSLGNLGAAEVELTRQGVSKRLFLGAGPRALAEARAFAKGQAVGDAAELIQHAPEVLGTLTQQVQAGATGTLSKALAANPLLKGRTDLDRAMKIALFAALKPKLGAAAAAQRVRAALFDYSDRPALMQLADRWGLWIFNGFPLAATKNFVETITKRPDLVARYPRLQQQLLNEFPGSREAYEQLPGYRRGPFTYPIGPDESGAQRFIDMGRVSPWSFPMGLAVQAGQLLRGEERQPPTSQDITSRGVFSPATRALDRAGKARGASPEEKRGIIVKELIFNTVPALRDLLRLRDAWAGRAGADYKFARPKEWAEAAWEAGAGISTVRGETRGEQAVREAPALNQRAPVTVAYFRQVDAALKSGRLTNPYAARFQARQNVDELKRDLGDAKRRFREMLLSPDHVENGKLTPRGASRIKESYLRFMALAERYVAVTKARR